MTSPDEEYASQLTEEILSQRLRRDATRVLIEEEAAAARGPRPKRTAAEYAEVPRPAVVLDEILAAEVNLLGGPSAAGKSLLARDWCLAVAAGTHWRGRRIPERRNVLWVMSEGTHDFRERWVSQPSWPDARDRVYVLDEPVNLVSRDDVEWLLKEYASERPGLVVFDVIYGMGMTDDNGVKEVLPVIAALKQISAEWGAATLALGHNGHNGERRFRGSSMWRQLAAVEHHLADGLLTCEKSKIADSRRVAASYRVDFPQLAWLTADQVLSTEAAREQLIEEDLERHPGDSVRARALRLMGAMNCGERTARNRINAYSRLRDG